MDRKNNSSQVDYSVIYSESGLRIKTEPYMVGRELEKAALESTMEFITSLKHKNLPQPVACLDILMGGRYYAMAQAWRSVMGPTKPILRADVRAKRYCEEGEWKVRVWHDEENSLVHLRNLEDTQKVLRDCRTLLIGDTIATGTTLSGVMSWVLSLKKKDDPLHLHIFSIAGSLCCMKKFRSVAKRIEANGGEISFTFANCALTLHKNGTDLEFAGAETHPRAQRYLKARLGSFMGKMKCAVWDWGDRFTKIAHHLDEIEEYYNNVEGTPDYILKGIQAATSSPSITVQTFFSKAGCDIVAQPYIVGKQLEELALEASRDFVKKISREGSIKGPVVVLDILMGGRYYGTAKAWNMENEGKCHLAEIRAKRYCEKSGEWKVRIWHDEEKTSDSIDSLEASAVLLRNARTILIGDTVATGTTLAGVINWVWSLIDEERPVDVHIFSICGSPTCKRKLSAVATQIHKAGGSITLHYANVLFHLNSNGTDLEFYGADMDPKAREYLHRKLGLFAPGMKCGIWDWGDRFTKIEHHLQEIKEYYTSRNDTPGWILEGISEQIVQQDNFKR